MRVGPGEHVVLIRHVAHALDLLALLVERVRLANAVAVTLDIAMQVGHIARDELTLGVVPRPGPDTLAGIDGGPSARCRGAQIRTPGTVASPGSRGQHLAVFVGSFETTEIATVA